MGWHDLSAIAESASLNIQSLVRLVTTIELFLNSLFLHRIKFKIKFTNPNLQFFS